MLLVFLMAACVAIMLYMELPRVAFEAERQRELLLVDRGNQFRRAIQVFVTDKVNNPTHRYPASIDELESFNNHRYLRRRYVDPMTGKDEWRLVHINGGVLTDSVTTQNNAAKGSTSASNTSSGSDYISAQGFMDTGAAANAGGGLTRALNRRPSDSQQPGAPGDPNSQAGGSPGVPPGLPPGAISGMGGAPGLSGAPGTPGAPSSSQPPAQPVCTAYIGGCPTTTASGQPQGQLPGQQSGQQMGQPGFQQGFQPGNPANPPGGMPPGMGGPGAQNAQSAANSMINTLLTSPRPNGMPTTMPGATIGGGIAGVASKYEAEGIMVINDRTAINEWEYIFDITKYRTPPNPVSGTVGTPQQPMGPGGPGGANPTGMGGPGTGGSPNMTTGGGRQQ